MKRTLIRAGTPVLAFAGLALVATAVPGAAVAATSSAVEYVSPTGASAGADTSCATAAFTDINAAVAAAPTGGTVIVCKGIYKTSVTVDKRLTLQGKRGAVINAKGQPYGVGMAADHVTVTGLMVENASDNSNGAPADGIITAGFVAGKPVAGNHDVVMNDVTEHNVGSGIDLNSTSYSVAVGNVSEKNGVGINVADDLGKPATHNLITGNTSNDNPGGCGFVLADHSGMGIYDNVVTGNTGDDNGLGSSSAPNASAGSGVILADAGPKGGVYNNTIKGNRLDGNGHSGIVLHAHVKHLNFSGNRILDNSIGTNNRRTDTGDKYTTGIYLGDVSSATVRIAGNVISSDHYGVFSAGPITITGKATDAFMHVKTYFFHMAKYTATK